jgi:hypothetical protein
VSSYALETSHDPFAQARGLFSQAMDWLAGDTSAHLTHNDLEAEIVTRFRDLARQSMQEHYDLRAEQETRLEHVVDADGVPRGRAEAGRDRALATLVGEVIVGRIAYRQAGHPDLHPADAVGNLPAEKHSHGLRRLAAIEATRGSFAQAGAAIERVTGVRIGTRQIEALAVRAAVDVDGFYEAARPDPVGEGLALGMSADAKGVVMRREALRPATAKAATSQKLATRLSAGEKRNKKRMAEIVAVFDCDPARRGVDDILPAPGRDPVPGPVTSGKWLAASVRRPAAEMIGVMFDEATRRDPDHRRAWFCVVDGNAHQIDRVTTEAATRGAPVTIIIDFIHVLEYLWTAAWCLHPRADPAAETWVRHQARRLLSGQVNEVIADLTTSSTEIDDSKVGIDKAVTYLTNQRPYLDYPTALANGWPIASGIIEGACRHLVKDRLDITGARWGLDGAEAILKLRALISNGDLDAYWTHHVDQEQQRVHKSRYANNTIPEP